MTTYVCTNYWDCKWTGSEPVEGYQSEIDDFYWACPDCGAPVEDLDLLERIAIRVIDGGQDEEGAAEKARRSYAKMNSFHNIIKVAALEFARANAIVMPGDFVMTVWGDWKKPHRVRISSVGAALAYDEFDAQNREFPAILEMTYSAIRLKANGEPKFQDGRQIVLTRFITESGVMWEQSKNTFNSALVHWRLPETWPYVPENEEVIHP